MQITDITVAASGALFAVGIPGRYIKYVSGTAGGNDTGIIVSPGSKNGNKVVLYPGQAYRVADDADVPDSWKIQTLLGAGTITGKVMVGNGLIYDNSLTGVVSTVDGSKARSLANAAFSAGGFVAAVAAQYGQGQLWNPANSGKRLVVESMMVYAASATTFYFESSTAAIGGTVENGQPKLLGGSASAASIQLNTTGSAPPAGSTIGIMTVGAGVTQIVVPHEPFIVPPGFGLIAVSGTVPNDLINVGFEWYEEPNV